MKEHRLPRYTSYPPTPFWEPMESSSYVQALKELASKRSPIALYIHIPFCKKRCLFCGCHVVLNRKRSVASAYCHTVLKEVELLKQIFPKGHPLKLLHLGGGTPTHLSNSDMVELITPIQEHFSLTKGAELSTEIDARTIVEEPSKLDTLKALGFNRLSFGVQDTDENVQRAIGRDQLKSSTLFAFHRARALGFNSLCIELIYGLPFQTEESFAQTATDVLALKPERIALYSYANVPWLQPHQKAIGKENMPDRALKRSLFALARGAFLEAGYSGIGMDHFALAHDTLALAKSGGKLRRTFQGYTTEEADNLIGLGVSSIGNLPGIYFQNTKEILVYQQCMQENRFAIERGKALSASDAIRGWVIHELMCLFTVNKESFKERFGVSFDSYFEKELAELYRAQEGLVNLDVARRSQIVPPPRPSLIGKDEEEGRFGKVAASTKSPNLTERGIPNELLENSEKELKATPEGEYKIREAASYFDAYYSKP